MLPNFQEIFWPLLESLSRTDERPSRDVLQELMDAFQLTPAERTQPLPNGKGELFENRVGWAMTYLKKAMLLGSSKRGLVGITERGREIVRERPEKIDVRFLKERYPEFKEWQERKATADEEADDTEKGAGDSQVEDETDGDAVDVAREQLLIERYHKYGRGKPSNAEFVFNKIFLVPSNRAAAENYLAECVFRAHANNPNNWQLTQGNQFIRMNVGFSKIMEYDRSRIKLFLLGTACDGPLRVKYSADIEFDVHFKNLGVETGKATFPPERFEHVIEDFKKANLAFLDLNSSQSKTSVWADSHSPGVLKYLRGKTQRPVPSPDFEPEYIQRMEQAGVEGIEKTRKAEPPAESPKPDANPIYTLDDLSEDTGFSPAQLDAWKSGIERKRQAVFFGPPGTGKTFLAKRLAKHLVSGGAGFIECIQFHPGYSYEEFIEGIRPMVDGAGGLRFESKPGRFLEVCSQARKTDDPCVLIIDEMNRANISKVFGELMHLLEYRDTEMVLAGGKRISIPQNVRIIGTMNTADRSIALVDFALRRRFAFLELAPEYDVLLGFQQDLGYDAKPLVRIIREANTRINDKNFHLGVSFFMVENLPIHLEGIWRTEIEPYLEEYFFGQPDTAEQFRWHKVLGRLRD